MGVPPHSPPRVEEDEVQVTKLVSSSGFLPPSLLPSLSLSLSVSLADEGWRRWLRMLYAVCGVLSVWLIRVYPGLDLEGYVWVRGKVWNAVEDGDGKLEVELLVSDDTPISVKGIPMFHLRKIPTPVAKRAKIVTVSCIDIRIYINICVYVCVCVCVVCVCVCVCV